MLLSKIRKSLMIFLLISIPSISLADTIEIKGLKIGMLKNDVIQKYPSTKGFTIAGVHGKNINDPLKLKYRDNKLDSISFLFNSKDFEIVLEAVREKFKSINCKSSEVSNKMGGIFNQYECDFEDSDSYLFLSRFVRDLDTSILQITSKITLNETIERSQKQKKDL